jgi:hypothetical protein
MRVIFNNREKDDDYIDTSKYGNYYRPHIKPNHNAKYSVLFILIIISIFVLWWGGFLKPADKELLHVQLLDRICEASVEYVKKPNNKEGIYGANIPGRVIYIQLNELIEHEYIEGNLKDIRTGDPIATSTNIRLEVLSEDDVMCSGLAFPEDDRIIPEVFLIGEPVMTINSGVNFVDPGAYATDNRDGNITNQIIRSGHVDINTPGTYYIYYIVKDKAGNLSQKIARTIIII